MSAQKTVLIVDDSEFDRALLVRALERKTDCRTLVAADGEQCLAALEAGKVDLVLMDILMPGAYGTHLLKLIREKHNPIELPVIMITAKGDAADIVGALQLGANDYIIKPVNFEVAVSRISTHLRIAELSSEMARLQEIASLHAMVTTYNHEINNPLAIALGGLEQLRRTVPLEVREEVMRAEAAMWRIAQIVKKIQEVTQAGKVQLEPYVGSTRMVKLT